MQQTNANMWSCRHCTEIFDTKGKRDSHYKKFHQESTKDTTIQRNKDGKFVCTCETNFTTLGALHKHQKTCTIEQTMSTELNGICIEEYD